MAGHGTSKVAFASPGNEFQFASVAPGDYEVMAFDRIDRLEYANPEVLNAYLGQASHVTLLPNGQAAITVNLIHLQP